ncbi:hypothetical protein pdam_00022791 [Pocillopora damicornis]|uniref:Uncharacterized protein n=1 Tax=Pocillopora damicornis TaxID=46731 RepID=A0A3M6UIX8_POCDA|nr:hypothetical protein pdam_00022791 [Pocillopora damicornis]
MVMRFTWMSHPQGTCVLLEVNTLNELINYFQGLYQDPMYIFMKNNLSAVPLKANHADAEITLGRITDHANKFYKEKLNGDTHPLTINNFPRTLQIYDADIDNAFNLEK